MRSQIYGRFHLKLDEHIAHPAATHRGHALSTQTHLPARLAATWDLNPAAAPVDIWYLDITAQCGGGHRHGHIAKQIVAVTLKNLVICDLNKDIEIALRSAACTHLPFA